MGSLTVVFRFIFIVSSSILKTINNGSISNYNDYPNSHPITRNFIKEISDEEKKDTTYSTYVNQKEDSNLNNTLYVIDLTNDESSSVNDYNNINKAGNPYYDNSAHNALYANSAKIPFFEASNGDVNIVNPKQPTGHNYNTNTIKNKTTENNKETSSAPHIYNTNTIRENDTYKYNNTLENDKILDKVIDLYDLHKYSSNGPRNNSIPQEEIELENLDNYTNSRSMNGSMSDEVINLQNSSSENCEIMDEDMSDNVMNLHSITLSVPMDDNTSDEAMNLHSGETSENMDDITSDEIMNHYSTGYSETRKNGVEVTYEALTNRSTEAIENMECMVDNMAGEVIDLRYYSSSKNKPDEIMNHFSTSSSETCEKNIVKMTNEPLTNRSTEAIENMECMVDNMAGDVIDLRYVSSSENKPDEITNQYGAEAGEIMVDNMEDDVIDLEHYSSSENSEYMMEEISDEARNLNSIENNNSGIRDNGSTAARINLHKRDTINNSVEVKQMAILLLTNILKNICYYRGTVVSLFHKINTVLSSKKRIKDYTPINIIKEFIDVSFHYARKDRSKYRNFSKSCTDPVPKELKLLEEVFIHKVAANNSLQYIINTPEYLAIMNYNRNYILELAKNLKDSPFKIYLNFFNVHFGGEVAITKYYEMLMFIMTDLYKLSELFEVNLNSSYKKYIPYHQYYDISLNKDLIESRSLFSWAIMWILYISKDFYSRRLEGDNSLYFYLTTKFSKEFIFQFFILIHFFNYNKGKGTHSNEIDELFIAQYTRNIDKTLFSLDEHNSCLFKNMIVSLSRSIRDVYSVDISKYPPENTRLVIKTQDAITISNILLPSIHNVVVDILSISDSCYIETKEQLKIQ